MLSLGPEQIMGELLLGTMGSMSELMSEGKSGSFFYYSNDALCAALPPPPPLPRAVRRLSALALPPPRLARVFSRSERPGAPQTRPHAHTPTRPHAHTRALTSAVAPPLFSVAGT